MNKSFVAIAALAVCAVAGAVAAQSTNDENQALLNQIQTDKRAIVLKGLQLTTSESAAFTPIYDEYEAERKQLADRTVALLDKFVANYDSMTDDAARGILKDWFSLEDSRLDLTKKYAKRFEKVLPAPKVLRFVQIENKLDTAVEMEAVRLVPLAKQ
jgi:Spy/CpxP family protein refolding chaperone